MTPLKQTAFRLPSEQIDALMRIKERDGVPVSEQVRRAVDAWIRGSGIQKAASRHVIKTRRKA